MKMLRGLSMLLASLTLAMTLTFGVVTLHPNILHAEEITMVQNQETSPAEDSLKICKDESGVAKACEDKDLIKHMMLSIGGFAGMSALAIAFFISKLLLLLLLSPFFTSIFPSLLRGDIKLLVATGMNLVVGVLSLMIPPVELSFGAAIMHSSVLALGSVFANQAYKQFLTSKGKA